MTKGFRSNFTFGSGEAEDDKLLSSAYFDNGDFEAIESPEDPRCFIIGRTGSGKSAALQHLEEKYPNKILRIIPENLSMPYITNLNVVRELLAQGVHLEPFFRALWKHVIVVEILKRRYGISSPEKKLNLLEYLKGKFIRDETKLKALEYLNEFGDKFWCETDERVKQIADSFQQKITLAGGIDFKPQMVGIGIEGSGNVENTHSHTTQQEIANRYQRIVNQTQLPRLNEMIVILNDTILDSKQHFTYLIIDDLDRQWVDEGLSNLLIRCLLETVMDMRRVKHLKILVALRSNIFHQLGFGSQSHSGQEEKLLAKILRVRWTVNDLRGLMRARATAASAYYRLEPPRDLAQMLPNDKRHGMTSMEYILSRTLMKPRDVISYLNTCVREAAGQEEARISWANMIEAEKSYSQTRLIMLREEWKNPYLGIELLCECFRGCPKRLSRADMTKPLGEIALLALDDEFPGVRWLTPMCQAIWEAPKITDDIWDDCHRNLIELLYTVSLIGMVQDQNKPAQYSYQGTNNGWSHKLLSTAKQFEIHPAFHEALSIG